MYIHTYTYIYICTYIHIYPHAYLHGFHATGSKMLQDASKSLQEPPRWLQDVSKPRKNQKFDPNEANLISKCVIYIYPHWHNPIYRLSH